MDNPFIRTELLIGASGVRRLHNCHIAVFGVGGVGSFTVEALVRAGIGAITIVDHDTVALSNLNRQLHATRQTIGRPKVDVMRERILAINPDCRVTPVKVFVSPDNIFDLLAPGLHYIVDAVDNVTAKIALAVHAHELGIPLISCMGAGNKLDPTRFEVADLFETSVCPLCRVMRRELRARGVPSLKVVYSTEPPLVPSNGTSPSADDTGRRAVPGSISFVPSAAGLVCAGAVVHDLLAQKEPL